MCAFCSNTCDEPRNVVGHVQQGIGSRRNVVGVRRQARIAVVGANDTESIPRQPDAELLRELDAPHLFTKAGDQHNERSGRLTVLLVLEFDSVALEPRHCCSPPLTKASAATSVTRGRLQGPSYPATQT